MPQPIIAHGHDSASSRQFYVRLTRKQRGVLRLVRSGFGPTDIARVTGISRENISRLKSRAFRNLRSAGIDPKKVLVDDELALLDVMG